MPLIINGVRIEYLTGFTDFDLLIPKYIYFPIILNLGEQHIDIKNPCTEPNSVEIPFFLNQLNTLASSFHIEIYSEDFMNYNLLSLAKKKDVTLDEWDKELKQLEHNEDHIRHFGALGLFNDVNNTLSCYYKDLKLNNIDVFNSKCKYPNIIWQYSDARKTFRARKFSLYNIENVTNAFQNIEHAIDKLALINDNYYEHYPKWLTSRRPEKMDTIEKKYNYANKIINDMLKPKEYEHSLDLPRIINLLQLILDFHESPDKAIESILNIPIIIKQIEKQAYFKLDIIKFKHHIKTYISYILGKFKQSKLVLCYIEFIKGFIIFLKDNRIENFPLFIEKINTILFCKEPRWVGPSAVYNVDNTPVQLITAPVSIILDIYFVLRILKNPRKDLVCNLSGSAHTKHISYFLTEILGFYEKIEFLNSNPLNHYEQCIHFNKEINLNDMLYNKKQKIELKQYENCDVKEKTCCNSLTGICRNIFSLGGKTKRKKNKKHKKSKRKINKYKR
jgi:hypothetical protein